MDEEYVFDGEITNEVIKRWAYDENMLLLDQDEDLVAGDREFFQHYLKRLKTLNALKGIMP